MYICIYLYRMVQLCEELHKLFGCRWRAESFSWGFCGDTHTCNATTCLFPYFIQAGSVSTHLCSSIVRTHKCCGLAPQQWISARDTGRGVCRNISDPLVLFWEIHGLGAVTGHDSPILIGCRFSSKALWRQTHARKNGLPLLTCPFECEPD